MQYRMQRMPPRSVQLGISLVVRKINLLEKSFQRDAAVSASSMLTSSSAFESQRIK